MSWDDAAEVCGNCRHWQLGNYQHDWAGSEPSGNKGFGCDGRAGECRRRAPIGITGDSPGANGLWPHTEKQDGCGEFERRAKSFRPDRGSKTDITGAPLGSA